MAHSAANWAAPFGDTSMTMPTSRRRYPNSCVAGSRTTELTICVHQWSNSTNSWHVYRLHNPSDPAPSVPPRTGAARHGSVGVLVAQVPVLHDVGHPGESRAIALLFSKDLHQGMAVLGAELGREPSNRILEPDIELWVRSSYSVLDRGPIGVVEGVVGDYAYFGHEGPKVRLPDPTEIHVPSLTERTRMINSGREA